MPGVRGPVQRSARRRWWIVLGLLVEQGDRTPVQLVQAGARDGRLLLTRQTIRALLERLTVAGLVHSRVDEELTLHTGRSTRRYCVTERGLAEYQRVQRSLARASTSTK